MKRLEAIQRDAAAINATLQSSFPDYVALSRPTPISIDEVKSLLKPNEALVLFMDAWTSLGTTGETFFWVITRESARWKRIDDSAESIARRIDVLRCGLDELAWSAEGWKKCRELTGKEPKREAGSIVVDSLPFDLSVAYSLYSTLFSGFEDLIRGRELILIPSGALSQLPLQVLVSSKPTAGDYKAASWLAREHAVTVLPSVPSMKALRRVARPSAATKEFIGFGNPLLEGDQENLEVAAYYKVSAALARLKTQCRGEGPASGRLLSLVGFRGIQPLATTSLADVSVIRRQAPLPETADELCAVAEYLKVGQANLWLGSRATEASVKRLSGIGELAKYRIVHFATHGALAGQLNPDAEPGLILTPPASASADDDGYLTASEIATLKLDADWVILSACNTAAGGASGAEALSGLARAFLYAGARSLVVSHWQVQSDATVRLITGAVKELAKSNRIGRAEALRRAMTVHIDEGAGLGAHPVYWAPFVLVGDSR